MQRINDPEVGKVVRSNGLETVYLYVQQFISLEYATRKEMYVFYVNDSTRIKIFKVKVLDLREMEIP